jgi:hypothetical protein
MSLTCFYRISDNYQKTVDSQGNEQLKKKPEYATKRKCFENFLDSFSKYYVVVIADCCSNETFEYLDFELTKRCKNYDLCMTENGNGAASFRKCLTMALDMEKAGKIKQSDFLYFVEDDYIHKSGSDEVMIDGLTKFDYVTLYDHPDKYVDRQTVNENGVVGNPFIQYSSESTRVFLGKYCHWKLTNSSTMTFGTKLDTLKNDLGDILKFVSGDYPHDFAMFCNLIKKQRTIGSSLPAYSTHCETVYMSPLVDWVSVIGN